MSTPVYLHFEDAAPEYTLKVALEVGKPTTVGQALAQFAQAYAGTGKALDPSSLGLATGEGKALSAGALLPCGLPSGSDLFVRSDEAPTDADEAAVAAAASAARAAAGAGAAGALRTGGSKVYAKEGSAIAASQAKMGENSYYYSVGKNRAAAQPAGAAPATLPQPKAVAQRDAGLSEATISSYSMLDDDGLVKVHIPLAGAAALPEGAITVSFRERSFDLRVTMASEGKARGSSAPDAAPSLARSLEPPAAALIDLARVPRPPPLTPLLPAAAAEDARAHPARRD